MASRRDDFDKATVEGLAKRAAYICSNPDCRVLTIAPSEGDDARVVYFGQAAHITAAAVGGPRFDPSLNQNERCAIENGIFLCSNCADMIDKNGGTDFPSERLRAWKRDHESWVRQNVNLRRQPASTHQEFKVSSYGQLGGITAGVVNVGPKARHVDARLRSQLVQLLPGQSRTVRVLCVLGDAEAFAFATEIKVHLQSMGYSVSGVDHAVFSEPLRGQSFDPESLTLRIGSQL